MDPVTRLQPYRKYAGRIAALSLALFFAGWALISWGNNRFNYLNVEVGAAKFDIQHSSPSNQWKDGDFIHANTVTGLIFGFGSFLFLIAVVGMVFTALLLGRKPPRGSILTLRGWKTPDALDEKTLAAAIAWETVLCGLMAGSAWVGMLWLGAFRLPAIPTLFVIWMIECGLLSCLGIFRCHHHYRQQATATQAQWMIAFALNYGGLLAFLLLTSMVLFHRFQA